MDIDGTLGVSVELEPGHYSLAVGHRNHLMLKNSTTQYLSPTNAGVWDFTADSGQYEAAVVEVESSVWAARAGDLNRDGFVTTRDYFIWYGSYEAGQSGYRVGDLDGDGLISLQDYNLWLSNARAGAGASPD
ncbi:hypothetical protein JXO59_12500 [candidate division KSB1 bacterium]|nr:hypothetical protein [candidate division KSB1 bacterium]